VLKEIEISAHVPSLADSASEALKLVCDPQSYADENSCTHEKSPANRQGFFD
jgi:hypothetical protein